jgi:hypothetical protein
VRSEPLVFPSKLSVGFELDHARHRAPSALFQGSNCSSLVCNRVASSSTLDACLRILACPRGVPLLPVPASLLRRFILVRSVPLRVPHSLPAVRPVGRTSSLGSTPFDGVPWTSPVWSGSSHPPRFRSQVFSTSQRFPGKSKLQGLVSCPCRPWDSSFRVFPSLESRTPLGATCSLAVIHRRAGSSPSEPCHRQFPRRPRSRAVACFP